jgi:single-strand DNA-binding protein
MNKVVLIGRLTKDPEVRYGGENNDKAVARFTVAVDRKFKTENQSADFINCIAFGKTAEFIEKYFTKGMRIAADGRIQTGSYTNKEGNKVYTTDVVLENVEFCEKKNSAQDVPPSQPDNDGFMNIPDGIDEDLPFN